jgi:PAS domain S-box-containing protein
LSQYLETGEGPVINQRVEITGMRADGTEFPVELSVIPLNVHGQPFFTGYLRDITERKQAEAEREYLLAQAQEAKAKLKQPIEPRTSS